MSRSHGSNPPTEKRKTSLQEKNINDKIARRSFVPGLQKTEVSDSDDETRPVYENVVIVIKPPKKHVSPRSFNAMMVGMTHHDLDSIRRLIRITHEDASLSMRARCP